MSTVGWVSAVTGWDCGDDDKDSFELDVEFKDTFQSGSTRCLNTNTAKDGRANSTDAVFLRCVRKKVIKGKGIKFADFKKLVSELCKIRKTTNIVPYVTFDDDQLDELELLNVDSTARSDGMTSLIFSCCINDAKYVRKMVNSGANINHKYNACTTALMEAAHSADPDVVKTLISAGAKKDLQNEDGFSALMIAALNGCAGNVEVLVKAGADVNLKTKNKYTALMLSAGRNHKEITTFLVEEGKANILSEDCDGLTAICWAFIYATKECFNYLLAVIMQRGQIQKHIKRRIKLIRKGVKNPEIVFAIIANVVSMALISDVRDVLFESSVFECLLRTPSLPNNSMTSNVLLAQCCLLLLSFCLLHNDQRFVDLYITSEASKILVNMLTKSGKYASEDSRIGDLDIIHLCATTATISASTTSVGKQWMFANCKVLIKSFDHVHRKTRATCTESPWSQYLRFIQSICTDVLDFYKYLPKAFGRPTCIPKNALESNFAKLTTLVDEVHRTLKATVSEENMKTLLEEEEETKRRAEKKREKRKTQKRKRKGPSEEEINAKPNPSLTYTESSSVTEKVSLKSETGRAKMNVDDVNPRMNTADLIDVDTAFDTFTVQMTRKQKRAAKKAASDPDESRQEQTEVDESSMGACGGIKVIQPGRCYGNTNGMSGRRDIASTNQTSRQNSSLKNIRTRSPLRLNNENASVTGKRIRKKKEAVRSEIKPAITRNRSPLKIVESTNGGKRHVDYRPSCIPSPTKRNKPEDVSSLEVTSIKSPTEKNATISKTEKCTTPTNDIAKWTEDENTLNLNADKDVSPSYANKVKSKELPCLSPKFHEFVPQKLVHWNENCVSSNPPSLPSSPKQAWINETQSPVLPSMSRKPDHPKRVFVDPCLYPYYNSLNNLNAPGISTPSASAFIGEFMPSLYDGVSFCSCESNFRRQCGDSGGVRFAFDLERELRSGDQTCTTSPFTFCADYDTQTKIINSDDTGKAQHMTSEVSSVVKGTTNQGEHFNIKVPNYHDDLCSDAVADAVTGTSICATTMTSVAHLASLPGTKVSAIHATFPRSWENVGTSTFEPCSLLSSASSRAPLQQALRNAHDCITGCTSTWIQKSPLEKSVSGLSAVVQPPPGFENCFPTGQVLRDRHELVPCFYSFPQQMTRIPCSLRWQHLISVMLEKKAGSLQLIGNMQTCLHEEVFCLHKNIKTNTTIFLGVRTDGAEIAIKRIPIGLESGVDEVKFIGNVKNENIIKFLDCTSDDHFLYVGMELGEYTLKEYVHKLDMEGLLQQKSRYLVVQLLQGLHAMHASFFAHLNLKPDSVLIDVHGVLKIAGFSKCKQIPEGAFSVLSPLSKPTCIWRSTESFVFASCNGCMLSLIADVQVAGMLVHYVATGGKHPFGGPDAKQISNNIRDGRMAACHVTDDAMFHLLGWMLHPNPDQRKGVAECLLHPYFWADKRRFSFLQKVGHELDMVGSYDNTSEVLLELNAVHQWTGYTNWARLVDEELLEMTSSFGYYYEDTGTDLVRFMSHIEKHLNEMPPRIRLEVKDPWLYFREKTPKLFLAVYDIIQRNADWTNKGCLRDFFKTGQNVI